MYIYIYNICIYIYISVPRKHQPWKRQKKNTRPSEAPGIEDLVVNSVALAFILQIDELLCSEPLGELKWAEV